MQNALVWIKIINLSLSTKSFAVLQEVHQCIEIVKCVKND